MPWIVDGATVAAFLGLGRVRILNDLEATAFGVGVLPPADLAVLYEGVPVKEATCVVIAAVILDLARPSCSGMEAAPRHGDRRRARGFRAAHAAAGGSMEISARAQ